jgi:hypothetical protein
MVSLSLSRQMPGKYPNLDKSFPIYHLLIILPSNATGFHIGEGSYCGLLGYDTVIWQAGNNITEEYTEFNPEDGSSTFLQIVGTHQQDYTVP